MSVLSFNILRSYYIDDPAAFVETVNGNSVASQIYKDLIAQIVGSVQSHFNSINSKIVRLDYDGNVMFANNDATFGQTKDDVKKICSRVEKAGDSEVLVADAVGKRAFIIAIKESTVVGAIGTLFVEEPTDQDNQFVDGVFGTTDIILNVSSVIWEYKSSRYISSFRLVPVTEKIIKINDDAIDESETFIRQGTTVTWENNSASPISIYSGTTSVNVFNINNDLNLYGDIFKSPVLNPGERYSFKFVTVGEYNWFVYPSIQLGSINVTRNRISSSDQFLILENDNMENPFTSRVIKVDSWGSVLWEFGNVYILKPRDVRPNFSNGVLIST